MPPGALCDVLQGGEAVLLGLAVPPLVGSGSVSLVYLRVAISVLLGFSHPVLSGLVRASSLTSIPRLGLRGLQTVFGGLGSACGVTVAVCHLVRWQQLLLPRRAQVDFWACCVRFLLDKLGCGIVLPLSGQGLVEDGRPVCSALVSVLVKAQRAAGCTFVVRDGKRRRVATFFGQSWINRPVTARGRLGHLGVVRLWGRHRVDPCRQQGLPRLGVALLGLHCGAALGALLQHRVQVPFSEVALEQRPLGEGAGKRRPGPFRLGSAGLVQIEAGAQTGPLMMPGGCVAVAASGRQGRPLGGLALTVRGALGWLRPGGSRAAPAEAVEPAVAAAIQRGPGLTAGKQGGGLHLVLLRDPSLGVVDRLDIPDVSLPHPLLRAAPGVHAVCGAGVLLAERRGRVLGDAGVGGEGAVGRVSLAVEVGELVNAVGGFGWGQVTRVVARGGVLQAFHAAPGAVLVRTPPQIAMLVTREIAGRGAGEEREKREIPL